MEKSEKSVQHTQTQQPIDKNCLSDLSLGGLSTIFLIILERNHSQNFDKKGHQLLMKYLPLLTREKNTSHPVFNFTYPPISSLSSGIQLNQLLVGFFGGSPKAQRFELRHRCVTWRKGNSNGGRWMGPFSKLKRIQVPHNYFFAIYKRRPKRRFVTPNWWFVKGQSLPKWPTNSDLGTVQWKMA